MKHPDVQPGCFYIDLVDRFLVLKGMGGFSLSGDFFGTMPTDCRSRMSTEYERSDPIAC